MGSKINHEHNIRHMDLVKGRENTQKEDKITTSPLFLVIFDFIPAITEEQSEACRHEPTETWKESRVSSIDALSANRPITGAILVRPLKLHL